MDWRLKLLKKFSQLSIVHKKFLKLLTIKLNNFHSIDRGERYWSIVFGAWLEILFGQRLIDIKV